jgi:hypothetical protein
MLLYKPPKPIAPALVFAPNDTTFYKHHGEDLAQYNDFRTRIAFLHEMLKFMPNWEQNGVAGFGEQYDAPGFIDGQTPFEGPFEDDGIGRWSENVTGRGYQWNGRIDGDNDERYGDWHRAASSLEGDTIYWGYNEGQDAQNLNFNPSSWEDFSGLENVLVDVNEYKNLLLEVNNDNDVNNDIDLGEIYANEWAAAKNYMQGFGDNSFYQIAMKGADTISFTPDPNDSTKSIGYNENNAGYLYKNGSSLDAYYMMLSVLESRRKIFYASADIFGPSYYIKDENKHGDIIDRFDHTMNTRFSDVDDQNKGQLLRYFELQHSMHSALPAFGIDNGWDINQWVYSARDRAAFEVFRDWVQTGVQNHIAGLTDVDEQDRIQTLYDEFTFVIDQPYGADGRHTDNKQNMVGWDFFLPGEQNQTNKTYHDDPSYNDSVAPPSFANPNNLPSDDYWHWMFSISQVLGLSEAEIKGNLPHENGGSFYNLFDTNWVVHTVGSLKTSQDVKQQRAVESQSINFHNQRTYRRQKRVYKEAVQQEKDMKYEEAKALQSYLRRRAARKSAANKAANRNKKLRKPAKASRPSNKAKKPTISYKEALQQSHNNMAKKSISRTNQRIKAMRQESQNNSKKRRKRA